MIFKKTHIFYGWILTIALWLLYFFATTPVNYGAVSVLFPKTTIAEGWSDQIVSYGTTAYNGMMALFSLCAGFIFSKIGMKRTMFVTAMMSAAGCIAIVFFPTVQALYVLVFGIFGMTMSLIAIVPVPALMNNWFDRNKSTPMSLVLTAGAVGGFLMPGIVEFLYQRINATGCWYMIAGALVISGLIVLFLVKETPEEIGEVKDGRVWVASHPSGKTEATEILQSINVRQALATLKFYMLSLQIFVSRSLAVTITAYIVLFSNSRGRSGSEAALYLTLYSVAGFIGRLSVSTIDRLAIPLNWFNTMAFCIGGAGMLTLAGAESNSMFIISMLLIGFAFGIMQTIFPLLVSPYFGNQYFAELYGVFNTIGSLGATVTPVIVLAVAAVSGGYAFVYVLFGALCIVCAAFAMCMPIRTKKSVMNMNLKLRRTHN